MVRTSAAVELATSLADSTKRRRAMGLVVFEDAPRAALHKTDVFFATVVANSKIYMANTEKKM